MLLGFLSLLLCIALLVGLVKPSLVIRWSKAPTRFSVFGYWLLSIFIIGFIIRLDEDVDESKNEVTNSNFELAQEYISEGKYREAVSELELVTRDNADYYQATQLLNELPLLVVKADSLALLTQDQKDKHDLAQEALWEKYNKEQEKIKQEEVAAKQIVLLEEEIKDLKDGIDFSVYRGTVQIYTNTYPNSLIVIVMNSHFADPFVNRIVLENTL